MLMLIHNYNRISLHLLQHRMQQHYVPGPHDIVYRLASSGQVLILTGYCVLKKRANDMTALVKLRPKWKRVVNELCLSPTPKDESWKNQKNSRETTAIWIYYVTSLN